MVLRKPQRIVVQGAHVAGQRHVQIALQSVGRHFDLTPRVDQRRPGVHPIQAILPGDLQGLAGAQLHGHQRDRFDAAAGLRQR